MDSTRANVNFIINLVWFSTKLISRRVQHFICVCNFSAVAFVVVFLAHVVSQRWYFSLFIWMAQSCGDYFSEVTLAGQDIFVVAAAIAVRTQWFITRINFNLFKICKWSFSYFGINFRRGKTLDLLQSVCYFFFFFVHCALRICRYFLGQWHQHHVE